MSDFSRKFMKKNALLDLYAGCVTPWDRNILSDMGLPSDVVDPFASQDTDPLSIMNLTFVSLKGWIEDAKKAPYYTERFVDLSKLVMKGVTTMGRGLVTLHKRGEDLSAAPMQIEVLISVGSYHFRKSYLGVVQFSAKRPEIGERLLLNQLRWADMLLRLYKTKEKLSEKPGIRSNRPEIKDGGDTDAAKAKLGGQENTAGQLSAASPFDSLDSLFVDRSSSLASHSSLNEPAAFSAQRALSALEGSKQCGKRKAEAHAAAPEAHGTSQTAAAPAAQEDRHPGCSDDPRNPKCANDQSNPKPEEKTSETEIPEAPKTPDRRIEESITKSENTEHEETPGDFPDQDRFPEIPEPDPMPDPVPEEHIHKGKRSPEIPYPDPIPETVRIMQNVFSRSESNGDGTLSFTIDEMRVLAADPIFADMEPRLAADIRNALAEYDSG